MQARHLLVLYCHMVCWCISLLLLTGGSPVPSLVSLPIHDHLHPLLILAFDTNLSVGSAVWSSGNTCPPWEWVLCLVCFGLFSRLTNLSHTPCILIITKADTKKVTVYCWIHKTGVGVVWKRISNRCLLWNRVFSFIIRWILPQLKKWKYEPASYLIKKSY